VPGMKAERTRTESSGLRVGHREHSAIVHPQGERVGAAVLLRTGASGRRPSRADRDSVTPALACRVGLPCLLSAAP
jgi:hypothetical protein